MKTYTTHISEQPRHTKYDPDAVKAIQRHKQLKAVNSFKKPPTNWNELARIVLMSLAGFAVIILLKWFISL